MPLTVQEVSQVDRSKKVTQSTAGHCGGGMLEIDLYRVWLAAVAKTVLLNGSNLAPDSGECECPHPVWHKALSEWGTSWA